MLDGSIRSPAVIARTTPDNWKEADGPPNDQNRANARLIAAAPDLLAALSEAVQWLDDLLAEEDPDGFIEAMQPFTDALVKATINPTT